MFDPTRGHLYKSIGVSSLVLFTATYSMTFLPSYLPEMILWLGYNEADKGVYVGVVAASFYLGAFVSGYPVSYLSNKLGFRRVMTGLLLVNAAYCLIFAFSNDLALVVVFYFLIGTCNALVSTSRAILSLFTDESIQTVSMTLAMIAWGCGLVCGSAIGGYASSPSIKYPRLFANLSFFERFPYFIPPASGTLISLIAAVLLHYFYPNEKSTINLAPDETHPDNRNKNHMLSNSASSALSYGSFSKTETTKNRQLILLGSKQLNSSEETIFTDDKTCCESSGVCECITNDIAHCDELSLINDDENQTQNVRPNLSSTLMELLRNKDVVKSVVVSTAIYCSGFSFIDIFAAWASTRRGAGGLGFSTERIGSVLSIVVIPCSIVQLVIGPWIERRIGSRLTLILYSIVLIPAVTLIPLCRFLPTVYRWPVVIAIQSVIAVCEMGITVNISVILNNSVTANRVASANGLTQSVNTLGKAIYSVIVGTIFSASITSTIGSPIDSSLVFVFIGMTLWVALVVTYFIPRRLDYKYDT